MSSERFGHGVDGLCGVALLDVGDHRWQEAVEGRGASEGLVHLVAQGGGEDGPVDGDPGGDADLAEGGVDTRGHARALGGDDADGGGSQGWVDHSGPGAGHDEAGDQVGPGAGLRRARS